jgi:hypothetical protein
VSASLTTDAICARELSWKLDLMLATIPYVFQDIYHFETQYTGLAYLGRKSMMIIRIFVLYIANIHISRCWHVCMLYPLRSHIIALIYAQIALGFMVKFNDKTVIRLKEKNGGKFERECPHLCITYKADIFQPRCASQTQFIAHHLYLPHSSYTPGPRVHPYTG